MLFSRIQFVRVTPFGSWLVCCLLFSFRMAIRASKHEVIVFKKVIWSGCGHIALRLGEQGRLGWQPIPTKEMPTPPLNLTLLHRNWRGHAITPSHVRRCAQIPHRRWVQKLLERCSPKIRRGVVLFDEHFWPTPADMAASRQEDAW